MKIFDIILIATTWGKSGHLHMLGILPDIKHWSLSIMTQLNNEYSNP